MVPECSPETILWPFRILRLGVHMSKARLEEAQSRYDHFVELAMSARRSGNISQAIAHAKAAWPYLPDMMKFEQKYEGRSFASFECIDLVLRYAPLMLDFASLDQLGEFLKKEKSVDRIATDDLAERLQAAREQLSECFRLWRSLEREPDWTLQQHLTRLGQPQAKWTEYLQSWRDLGFVFVDLRRFHSPIRLKISLGSIVDAHCTGCGEPASAPKRTFFSPMSCTACGTVSHFIIDAGGELAASKENRA
jgi:hypothetical protein